MFNNNINKINNINTFNPDIQQALSDKFNRKKTLAKDMNHIQHFYQTNKTIGNKIKMVVSDTDTKSATSFKSYDAMAMGRLNVSSVSHLNMLHKKDIRVIHNVYQESYIGGKKATGLGDFIRGCYFLIQFCKKHNFQFHFTINHPLALFLEKCHTNYYVNQREYGKIFSSIQKMDTNNWLGSELDANNYLIHFKKSTTTIGDITTYFNKLPVYNNSIFGFNCMFPYDTVLEDEKGVLREIFEPTLEMKELIEKSLHSIGLSVKNYSVIHIRSGDKYLFEETKLFGSRYFKNLCKEVEGILSVTGCKFLFIADNNEIKYLLRKKFPAVKVLYNGISHFGEGRELELGKIRDSMLDFYLMANSAAIYSFTNYIHGSGFSLWCSVTYNIPYRCKLIKNG